MSAQFLACDTGTAFGCFFGCSKRQQCIQHTLILCVRTSSTVVVCFCPPHPLLVPALVVRAGDHSVDHCTVPQFVFHVVGDYSGVVWGSFWRTDCSRWLLCFFLLLVVYCAELLLASVQPPSAAPSIMRNPLSCNFTDSGIETNCSDDAHCARPGDRGRSRTEEESSCKASTRKNNKYVQ